ncbi:MAG: PAS domain S-box protein, partial [Methanobacteriota archaeon]
IGLPGSLSDISAQLFRFRTLYPHAVIIRCISESTRDSDRVSLIPLFDGYFIIESASRFWIDNLTGIINQAISFRDRMDPVSETKEKFYQNIFNNNPIPLALTIPESGTFVEVNDSFLQTYGYSREEVIGKRSFDLNIFVSKEERDRVINSCTREHPSRDMEVRIRTKDKQIIIGLFSADIMFRDGQELLFTTMKDISKQKSIENEIRNQNRFIQDILLGINEGIIVYDITFGYRVWNSYMEVLTGIPASEILGKPKNAFNPTLEGDDLSLLIKRALQGYNSTSKDVFYSIPSTGKTGWISIIYAPYRDLSGNIFGVIASVRDINDRKRHEDLIIAHEIHLRSIIDTVPVGIVCLDQEMNITLVNTNYCSALGLSLDKVVGQTFDDIFLHDGRFHHHHSMITRALDGRQVPFNEEMEDQGSVHRKKYIRGRYSPLKGQNGKIDGVVCVIIDITDLKVTQHAVESINSKLHLLSSITRHDILNSLTAVLGYLAIAIEEKDPDTQESYLYKAYQTALLIQEQAEFSRDYQDIGVNKPIWHIAKNIFTTATKSLNPGDISVEISLDDLRVYADPLLERVIYNLVDNSLRYGGTVTRISSYWRQESDQVVWVIEDNGVGIGNDMKNQIFQKGVGHNTGLGLFLTREILDITGLIISETGVEGEGARFEITIPSGLWQIDEER